MTFLSFNLLTGAESPVRAAEPPYLLITSQLIPKHSKYVEDFGNDGTQAKIGFCYDIS
ncbi:RHS repeat protein, partial [Leptospira santarosai]